jgi:hypothetical protein
VEAERTKALVEAARAAEAATLAAAATSLLAAKAAASAPPPAPLPGNLADVDADVDAAVAASMLSLHAASDASMQRMLFASEEDAVQAAIAASLASPVVPAAGMAPADVDAAVGNLAGPGSGGLNVTLKAVVEAARAADAALAAAAASFLLAAKAAATLPVAPVFSPSVAPRTSHRVLRTPRARPRWRHARHTGSYARQGRGPAARHYTALPHPSAPQEAAQTLPRAPLPVIRGRHHRQRRSLHHRPRCRHAKQCLQRV